MRVFVPTTGGICDWKPVRQMFLDEGWEIGTLQDNIDLVCFTGGADVSPELYGEVNTYSLCDSGRDEKERIIYDMALTHGIPMVGICRGGQFLNVMNGGKMIQHIEGHSGDREIQTLGSVDEPVFIIREDHHQGILCSVDGTIVAEDVQDGNQEIVWYEKTKSLCFQPHPEWGHEPTKELFFDLIKEYVI